MQLLAIVISAVVFANSALAETIHLQFTANTTLCAGPTSLVAPFDHAIVVLPCGTSNATSSDLTALTVTSTDPGTPTQISFGDMCAVPPPVGSPDSVVFAPCSADLEQLWTFASDGTIEDADGTCLTVGRAGQNAPATIATCGEFPEKQGWEVVIIN